MTLHWQVTDGKLAFMFENEDDVKLLIDQACGAACKLLGLVVKVERVNSDKEPPEIELARP
ncbi:MAG: hypothetical protein ACRECH_09105 [Nitrososphaerales archaeon]